MITTYNVNHAQLGMAQRAHVIEKVGCAAAKLNWSNLGNSLQPLLHSEGVHKWIHYLCILKNVS